MVVIRFYSNTSNILYKNNDDWIVLSQTMQTLAKWAITDEKLKTQISSEVDRLTNDSRKSVAGKAEKLYKQLYN